MNRSPSETPAARRSPLPVRRAAHCVAVLVVAGLLFLPAYSLRTSATSSVGPARLSTLEPDPDPETEARPNAISPRLLPRPLPANPTQADLGAQVYYQICMACHGDFGQGLTDEWREAWGGDSYCWTSKCHAANHPPEGFDLPRTIGPVLGTGTLLSYPTGLELLHKVHDTMPWWNPGSLTSEQALQVTAYLLRARGELPSGMTLDEGNAAIVQLQTQPAPRGNESQLALGLSGLLGVAGLAVAIRRRPRL